MKGSLKCNYAITNYLWKEAWSATVQPLITYERKLEVQMQSVLSRIPMTFTGELNLIKYNIHTILTIITILIITLRLPYQWIFFIIRFYAIMHRTTIVQNKIISSICSCLFFCQANIYRPSLGKVRLGRPNPHPTTTAQFLSQKEKKDHSTQNCMHYNTAHPNFQFFFSFI